LLRTYLPELREIGTRLLATAKTTSRGRIYSPTSVGDFKVAACPVLTDVIRYTLPDSKGMIIFFSPNNLQGVQCAVRDGDLGRGEH
jgi:hypothetical protein